MYSIIGLRTDGRMVLYSYSCDPPNEGDLVNELQGFGYTQVLVIRGGSQVIRYEYHDSPRLETVELA